MVQDLPDRDSLIQARQSFAPGLSFNDFHGTETIFDALNGHEEQLAGVGASVADVAIDRKLEIEDDRRREDDGPNYGEIVTEARRQREAMEASYSNGFYNLYGMDIAEEDLEATFEDSLSDWSGTEDRYNLTPEQSAELYALTQAFVNETDPARREEILESMEAVSPEYARGQADEAFARGQQNSHDLNNAAQFSVQAEAAPEDAIEAATTGSSEQRDAVVTHIEDEALQEDALEARYSEAEADELMSNDGSAGGLMFADTRDGPVLSTEGGTFQTAALGDTRDAPAIPEPSAPEAQQNLNQTVGLG